MFYSHPFQDYQHVRVCQSQVAEPSQANARQEPVPATTGLYIGSFLKGLFNFRALSVQLEYLHSLQITTDLLTLTLEQVGFSRGGEGDFPCTACCELPRAQQGRQSHTHTSSPTAAKGGPICSHLPSRTQPIVGPSCFLTTPTSSAQGQGENIPVENKQPTVMAGKRKTLRVPGEHMCFQKKSPDPSVFPHHSHFPQTPYRHHCAPVLPLHRNRHSRPNTSQQPSPHPWQEGQ